MAGQRTLELRPEDLPAEDRTLELRPEDLPVVVQTLAKEAPRAAKKAPFYMDPTEGMSTGQKLLAGAGKFFSDTGSGARQVLATPLNALGQAVLNKDMLSHDYEGEKERKRLDTPLMNTAAGNVGYAGAGMTALALPGAALTTGAAPTLAKLASMVTRNPTVLAALAKYAPLAASSAGLSTLTPTTREGERGENAALAAALSPAFQKTGELAGRAMKPAVDWLGDHANLGPVLRKSWASTATPQQSQTVARAMMNDVPVYPSQLKDPGSSLSRGKSEGQLKALTTAVNRTMGEETENIGGAFITARDRLSDTYNALLNGKRIQLNAQSGPAPANAIAQEGGGLPRSQFVQRVMDIGREHNTGAPILQPNKELNDAIEQAIGYAQTNGELTGRQYQELLRRYAESAKRASRGTELNISDPRAAKGFSDLTDALTEQAEKAMAPHELDMFKTANKQWRNMKTLESLAPTKVDGGADYNPAALARKLARTDKDSFMYGKGDPTLGDLGKFGATYMGMDANAPQSLLQRVKTMTRHATPILVGDALGAAAAGYALDDDSDHDKSLASSGLKYGTLALLMHGLLTGGKNAMNPRLTMDQLRLPQGALSELFQRSQVAPAAAALLHNQKGEDQ